MKQFYLGIDVGKESFTVALLGGGQVHQSHFKNDSVGFERLGRWLQKQEVERVHACMEATNRYWQGLALFLDNRGFKVSVVNPKLIKRHSQSVMQRNKTDRQDALTIADYCCKQQPERWQPAPLAYRELRELVRHVSALKSDRTRALNRQQSGLGTVAVLRAIEAQIEFLNQQIVDLEQQIIDHIDRDPGLKRDKELLLSIPGIGDTTAAVFLAEVQDVSRFSQARQLDAYAGLTPGQRESGTSAHGRPHLIKWGNVQLRTAFYMPALSAYRWNPVIAALHQRMQERGKSRMTIVTACMRKLLHLCYGVLKTRKPFDPDHALQVSFST
jgi:transposase